MNVDTLISCGLMPTQAKIYAPLLGSAFDRHGITLPEQRAGFLAEAMHESMHFTQLEELLSYRSVESIKAAYKRVRQLPAAVLEPYVRKPVAFANFVYAGINGNGNAESGDGWRYRGSGLFQLTGLANFERCGAALGRPYAAEPDRVRKIPEDALESACWFWLSNGLNAMMANGWIDKVSVRINGGENGLIPRRQLYYRCLAELKPTT